ncbi:iron transporter FeoB [Porphyromonas sp. COT-108 OH2963]|nr:iron transporter FeoB [Porphyromonas sp. COT-108 OH2963]
MKRQNVLQGGSNTSGTKYTIALAGNPNTGKSTLFNGLTGLHQHTGNWPGKTVARAEGSYTYEGEKYRIVDLPGTYSLFSRSEDEEIARNFILFGQPDATIIVADATRLERNLNLTLQILEITENAILVVNLIDEARSMGITIDAKILERRLGIPVALVSARSGEGLDLLLKTISQVIKGDIVCRPHRIQNLSGKAAEAIEAVEQEVKNVYPDLPNAKWVAMRLIEGDAKIIEAVRSGKWIDEEILLQ